MSKKRERLKTWVSIALVTSPAEVTARDWPETAGWTIYEGEQYCGMALEYEGKGDTQLSVAKFLDGHALVIVTNQGWSAKKDQPYDLKFYVGDQVFAGGKSMGTGETYERKGFATQFEASFFDAYAKGASFRIYMGDTLVDSLRLTGSAAAMVTVNRCLAGLRTANAAVAREKQRFSHIADDPFAGSKAPPEAPEVAPERAWVTTDDYPPSAIRASEEGTTKVTYTVNATGRIENCRTATSSGSDALDRATCQAITRRGRFSPRTADSGSAASYDRSFSFTWKLPTDR